ncbi:hypothetical protein AGDE_08057 [Angomonas deanei]|uniref:Thioesterase superfamily n=1 Tax=Angomonas deanei TaxID=59799 RepID=A0A7G2CNA1_9TRYP|nr:hypothetical protein AGDE_08057 [Angomonas deanei]CAD2220925.1 hypothetical protein, conserved [Angomonas deanei]|eukprot:EPY34035.1 hypothetical protein AGDE_08057 [Angomonas deanei]
MSLSIEDSPLWQSPNDLFPEFSTIYSHFCTTFDKYGGPLMHLKLKLFSKDFRVACISNGGDTNDAAENKCCVYSPNRPKEGGFPFFPFLCLVPVTVTEEVCDDGFMTLGAMNALMDMVTSFHIMMAAFPEKPGHVSVTIQTNQLAPLACGDKFLVISKVDKLGGRLVFNSVQYIAPTVTKENIPETVWAENQEMKTVRQLLNVIGYAPVFVNLKHIKSLLSMAANKQAVEQREKPKAVVDGN